MEMKFRVEINKIGNWETTEKMNETKNCFFEMINTDNTLVRLIKEDQRYWYKLSKLGMKDGISTDP